MDIINGIEQLNLAGKPVCIHASLRSFGTRAEGLLEGFLEAGCTVMVPTFSDMYEAPPVPAYMPEQNGAGDYSYFFEKYYENAGVYDPSSDLVSVEEMGVFSQLVLQNPERVRGNNYLNSFAAVGALAEELISGQSNENVYAPLEKLYEQDGFVLLIGTDLRSCTAIHYAEQLEGRLPFVRWAKGESGETVPVCAGGCSDGFEKLTTILRPFERQCAVKNSLWRCYKVRDLVDACAQAFRKDPMIAHCGDPDCCRCNDAVKGGPLFS